MPSEPKYKIHVMGHLQDLVPREGWRYNAIDDEYTSQTFDDWDQAMDRAVKLGIGRVDTGSGCWMLDPGVEIKAVPHGQR